MKSIQFFGRALATAAAFLAPLACYAVDGTVTITGNVTNETCVINGGSPNFAVALPTVSKSALGSVGAFAGSTPFSIALTGCTITATGSLLAYFEPGATINPAGRLTNSGSATNIDIELLNSAQGIIDLTKSSGNQNASSASVTSATTNTTLTYYARYKATAVPVGVGTVSTTVTYTIVYP
jgi:major type 1 subunit fimbrin (pilin)